MKTLIVALTTNDVWGCPTCGTNKHRIEGNLTVDVATRKVIHVSDHVPEVVGMDLCDALWKLGDTDWEVAGVNQAQVRNHP